MFKWISYMHFRNFLFKMIKYVIIPKVIKTLSHQGYILKGLDCKDYLREESSRIISTDEFIMLLIASIRINNKYTLSYN